jgi:hypothetical protein
VVPRTGGSRNIQNVELGPKDHPAGSTIGLDMEIPI